MRILFVFLLVFLQLPEIHAQTQRAEALRNNVVAIEAEGQSGFGFITGMRNDQLFVVTAAHVVEAARNENQPVGIKFYNDYKAYSANVIRYFGEDDIALLEVNLPANFTWDPNCLGTAAKGMDVAFVGRDQDWYVPLGRALGVINRLENNRIMVDITSVKVGTSGAPLISESGIIGMIVSFDGIEATALDINLLRTRLSEYDYFFSLTSKASNTNNGKTSNTNNGKASNTNPTDRDGNTYSTKIMADGHRWMTQNLNLKVNDSWCYKDDPSYCAKYGRLYTWEAAKEACDALGNGWRLPTDEEWREMAKKYGGADDDAKDGGKAAYQALIANGSSGFAAQLGGWRLPDGSFYYEGSYGRYWSSSPSGSSDAWLYYFGRDYGKLGRYDGFDRGYGFSVRCRQGS